MVWFGASSFWGHLRHLFSAAIATENIDSRDWMTPDEPRALAGAHRRKCSEATPRRRP